MKRGTIVADPVQVVLERLEGVKDESTGQWSARCPAHEDRNPSLSIGVGDDGKVLLHCQAGCSIDEVLAAMNPPMTKADLFASSNSSVKSRNAERKIVETYDYSDTFGVLLFQVVRYQPKDFRQRRPDGDGEWLWNLKGVDRVLYRLQALTGAADHCTIYIVEGEHDADRLSAAGLIATTNPGGAGKWGRVDDTVLHGRHVAIIADNDEPGRKHAQDVATHLHGKAASVRIVELPGLAEHGDVSDWLDAGNDPTDLDRLAAEAPEWEPATAKTKADGRLRVTPLATVEPQRVRWLWPGRIPLGKLSLIAGIQGLGKSFLTLDMASRVSRGAPWPDALDDYNQQGNVILLSAEDALADTVVPRLNYAGANLDRISAIEGTNRADHTGDRFFDLQRDIHLLSDEVERFGEVRLIVFDPIDSYLGAGINSNKGGDVRRVLSPLAELAESTRAAVVVVAHLNKTPNTNALFRVCGSIAYTAISRAAWLIAENKDDPQQRFFLKLKFNLAQAEPNMAFTIDRGAVNWHDGYVDITADEVLGDGRNGDDEGSSKIAEAMDFLKESLSNGQQKAADVQKWATENGIAKSTLKRARLKLRIKPTRIWGGTKAAWYWSLNQEDQTPRQGTDGPLGPLGLLTQEGQEDQEDHRESPWDPLVTLPSEPGNEGCAK